MYQISFSSIREWIHDLIFGRTIPKPIKYMTVDIQKLSTPFPVPPPKLQASIRRLNGERIVVLPFEDPAKLTDFVNSHKNMVYCYMLRRFEIALQNKRKSVVLFQLGNSTKVAELKPDNYRLQLSKMLTFFVGIEDYESAGRCRDLIKGN